MRYNRRKIVREVDEILLDTVMKQIAYDAGNS